MLEILLFGLVVVVAYVVSHHAVMAIERRHGGALGAWRMLWFFIIFLGLLLIAQWLVPLLLGPGVGT
ncbi:MAG: hypothetical protein ACOCSR_00735 [Wenzhouxiangella sp.]